MNSRSNKNETSPDLTSDLAPTSDPVAAPAFDDAQPTEAHSSDVAVTDVDTAASPQTSSSSTPVNTSGGGLGSAWVTLVIGAILLILLLVFVLQNQESLDVKFISWEFSMPAGVLILLAAIIGALVMALVAAMRIFQLRHRARKANKSMGTKKSRKR